MLKKTVGQGQKL